MKDGIETERKYLIRMPDVAALAAMPGARVLHMEQTYLKSVPEVAARVRKITENGVHRYIRTEKRRISALSAREEERDLTAAEYTAALADTDPERMPIRKTRYVIPHGTLFCEIDVFSFWDDRAILEIELPDEAIAVILPDYVTLIREVSGERRYSNRAMAKNIPQDNID